jgi:transposase
VLRTSKIVEALGNLDQIKDKAKGQDPYKWMEDYVAKLNKLEKEENRTVALNLNPNKELPKDKQVAFNGGYLFLQKIYYDLGLNTICKEISSKYKFEYDLDSILSRLVYSRVIYPSSKLTTYELCKNFIEPPNFDLHHIYRALQVIANESDFIQSQLYQNSVKHFKRNNRILYYDCTNYYFEIEQEDGLKQYGKSKENRPNPIVQMGLFMDGDGIPLAMDITPGNTNEQTTLKPIEQRVIKDFKMAKIVVCTDAGLASLANRKLNSTKNRAFITVQSIKKLKKFLMVWALDSGGWSLANSDKMYDISKLEETLEMKKHYQDKVFYKERWINENNFEQRLIITFSLKYRDYQRNIRTDQIQRAQKLIDTNPKKLNKARQNDYKRFISKINVTQYGEIAEETIYELDEQLINKESIFDGFYGVCTNLEDDVPTIIEINKRRWQLEECFRIMKSDFKAQPVHVSRDDSITAHFLTCFLALTLHRYLEKRLTPINQDDVHFTATQIFTSLKDYNFIQVFGDGYIPTYTRNEIIDSLHEVYGFRTDYEIVPDRRMKKILKLTKNQK